MAETLKEKTAKGLFWGAINNGSTQILNLIIGIFLARLLTPADYGIVGVLAVFTAIAGVLSADGRTSSGSIAETAARNATIATYRRTYGCRITSNVGHTACRHRGSGDGFRKIYRDGFIIKQLS